MVAKEETGRDELVGVWDYYIYNNIVYIFIILILYINYITYKIDKQDLYSTVNYIQYLVITCNGKESEKVSTYV